MGELFSSSSHHPLIIHCSELEMLTAAAFLLSFGLAVNCQSELTIQTTKGPVVGFYDPLGSGGIHNLIDLDYSR